MKKVVDVINHADTDLVLRNLIFSVLYVCGILLFFNYLLWPAILSFKSQYIIERKEKIITQEIKNNYDGSVQRVQDFLQHNKSALTTLNNASSLDVLQQFVARYLTIISVQKTSHTIQDDAQTQSDIYTFITRTNDLAHVWEMIDKLPQFQASMMISPPLHISKPSLQSSTYDVRFSLEILSNIYHPSPHIETLISQVAR